jgi:hypothetical protein
MFMPKKPLSVTLDEANILWLRGRARSGKERSLSEALDGVVTSARQSGYGGDVRSVVGTVDISPDDPDLRTADVAIQTMIDARIDRQAKALASRSMGPQRRPATRKAARRG